MVRAGRGYCCPKKASGEREQVQRAWKDTTKKTQVRGPCGVKGDRAERSGHRCSVRKCEDYSEMTHWAEFYRGGKDWKDLTFTCLYGLNIMFVSLGEDHAIK